MEQFIQNFIKYFIIISSGGIVVKFMSKARDEEKKTNSDIIVFEIKKNAKLVLYIACFVFLVILPAASINLIIKDKDIGLLIFNFLLLYLSIYY